MPDHAALPRLRELAEEHVRAAQRTGDELLPAVARFAEQVRVAFEGEGRVLVFGNGGSAADAQHFAAEFTGHFDRDRRPLPALALTTDSSALTAIANDYSYTDVFSRQVSALAGPADVVVGISTSGDSPNVLAGLASARARGAFTVALTGGTGGGMREAVDLAIVVPATATARIQEMHILIIHMVSELVDAWAAETDLVDRRDGGSVG